MGTTGSTCVETPVRVAYNKHLSNALDPRSPSTGILRTPIEVLSSPSAGASEAEFEEDLEVEDLSGPMDPRSPTPGVSRTPLKLTMADKLNKLVRQLSGVFISEEPEPVVPVSALSESSEEEEATSSEDPVDELLDCEEEVVRGGGRLSVPELDKETLLPELKELVAGVEGAPQPAPARPHNLFAEDDPQAMKWKQVKPASKALLVSGTGRSPLQLLRDDNSPTSILARRQVNKTLSEKLGDPEPRRMLKVARNRPFYQDKENSSYHILTGDVMMCPP
ncbi:cell division cycle-associated protein 3 [Scyliorhinus canicula]|uniref:cell division cycle-associated protein 3 n=1 Tax=Scyliorhinus canicula TaxID=7830 RepID=UPI0018F71098|nr:cell division cycle-associated protein 3 [Scyliorhinus canicula]XP_038678182.1 cell division cycle-associated protein 3 [Scyliorhinus canicula]XP_038678183.1 cell division cycle-associated protein 3 [Scyliorhinus canicula]XP_038678184.1 cell division cycle-associated protein 3 [Scyliorhinus canicula]